MILNPGDKVIFNNLYPYPIFTGRVISPLYNNSYLIRWDRYVEWGAKSSDHSLSILNLIKVETEEEYLSYITKRIFMGSTSYAGKFKD